MCQADQSEPQKATALAGLFQLWFRRFKLVEHSHVTFFDNLGPVKASKPFHVQVTLDLGLLRKCRLEQSSFWSVRFNIKHSFIMSVRSS